MKTFRTPFFLILLIAAAGLLLAACGSGEATPAVDAPINPDPTRIQLELVANQSPDGYYQAETGALVQVLASGFPSGETVRLFLSAPGADYKDPVATAPVQENGEGQLVFFFPQRWDDGNPVEPGQYLLIAEWDSNEGAESMTINIEHIAPSDS